MISLSRKSIKSHQKICQKRSKRLNLRSLMKSSKSLRLKLIFRNIDFKEVKQSTLLWLKRASRSRQTSEFQIRTTLWPSNQASHLCRLWKSAFNQHKWKNWQIFYKISRKLQTSSLIWSHYKNCSLRSSRTRRLPSTPMGISNAKSNAYKSWGTQSLRS